MIVYRKTYLNLNFVKSIPYNQLHELYLDVRNNNMIAGHDFMSDDKDDHNYCTYFPSQNVISFLLLQNLFPQRKRVT